MVFQGRDLLREESTNAHRQDQPGPLQVSQQNLYILVCCSNVTCCFRFGKYICCFTIAQFNSSGHKAQPRLQGEGQRQRGADREAQRNHPPLVRHPRHCAEVVGEQRDQKC